MRVPRKSALASVAPTLRCASLEGERTGMAKEQQTEDALPACGCGTTRASRAAVLERDYSTLGAVYLLWGGTSRPVRVTFRCAHCGEAFDACTNRSELAEYVI
jgi:hypothetical protein